MARTGVTTERHRFGDPIGISSTPSTPRRGLALLDRQPTATGDDSFAPDADTMSLFTPVVAPTAPLTPGLGHALGAGRRMRHRELRAAEQAGSLGTRWWESPEYAALERAVEEAFADPSQTGELARPFVDFVDAGGSPAHTDAVWAGIGVVPPPTPVFASPSETDVTAPITRPLPTRRELRRQRAAKPSARTVAARRLGKGSVLAMTMFGVVASNLPQDLHDRLFGDRALVDLVDGATSAAGADVAAASLSAPHRRDAVEQAVRDRLAKDAAVQSVSQAGQNVGSVIVAAAKAQAAADAQVARIALDRATREAQRNPRALARLLVAEQGWSASQFVCLDKLWMRESTWRWNARNPSSGAYGIPQALPASKMASAGSDWRTNPATQMEWGLDYIEDRYGTPCGAWGHSQSTGWY